MPEITNELMYEVLKALQGDISGIRHDMRDMKSELHAIRGHIVATQQDVANIYSSLGRHEIRFDRIERRLELVDTAL